MRGMRRNLTDPATRWPTLACLAGAVVAVFSITLSILPMNDSDNQAAALRNIAPFITIASGAIVAFAAATLARRTHK